MKALGYQSKSSGGLRVLAAMLAFGLIADEGSGGTRKVKLTELGYRLMVLPEDDPDHAAGVREAAVKPPIYADLLKQWNDGLPNDDAISKYLLINRKFNPTSVKEMIRDFRATYVFAKLDSSATLSAGIGETHEKPKPPNQATPGASMIGGAAPQGPLVTNPGGPPPPALQSLQIQFGPGRRLILEHPTDLSRQDIEEFDEMWAIHKRRLLRQQESTSMKPEPDGE